MEPKAHEKMLNIANHQASANQNHWEFSPRTYQNGYDQKEPKRASLVARLGKTAQRMLVRMWR